MGLGPSSTRRGAPGTRLRWEGTLLPAAQCHHVGRSGALSLPVMATLSSAFSARLDHLPPSRKVRVIVVLDSAASRLSGRRGVQTRRARARLIETTEAIAAVGLRTVDQVLKRYGGRRASGAPSVLGSVLVETTPAGVRALAKQPGVNAVLEDQPIRALGS